MDPAAFGLMNGVQQEVMERLRAAHSEGREVPAGTYEFRITGSWFALVNTYEELWHLQPLITNASTLEHLRLLIKMYVISWATLSDTLAVLINEVYDLGYAEKDVTIDRVLGNRRVGDSAEIWRILKAHGSAVKWKVYIQRRNDIVHRGKFQDPDVDDLFGEWMHTGLLFSYMQKGGESAETRRAAFEQAALQIDFAGKLHAIAKRRSFEYTAHLRSTRTLLDEIAPVLIQRIHSHSI